MLVLFLDQADLASSESPEVSDTMSNAATSCDKTVTDSLANLDRGRAYSRAYSRQGPPETASVAACTSDELWCKQDSNADVASNAFLGVNIEAQLGTLEGFNGKEVYGTSTERFGAFHLREERETVR
jgi:hypothetical protein